MLLDSTQRTCCVSIATVLIQTFQSVMLYIYMLHVMSKMVTTLYLLGTTGFSPLGLFDQQ